MNLTTTVPISALRPKLDYHSRILCLGSCFAQNMGHQLQNHGFDTVINPFGIIFNPISLAILIEKSCNSVAFNSNDVESNFSFFAHSDLNGQNKQEVLDHLNKAQDQLSARIKTCSHIFITMGTAWVYKHIEKNLIVANCHKQPQHLFSKQLLSSAQINEALDSIKSHLKKINPQIILCYTLSPVRHLKDGFVENTRSKSRLHDAIQTQVANGDQYFPAYEIVLDELRDYRFYKRDMIHLNETGLEYVWLCFRESGINEKVYPLMQKVENYQKLRLHRPKNVEKHTNTVQAKKKELLNIYPYLNLP